MRKYLTIALFCTLGMAAAAYGQATVYTNTTHADPYAAWNTDAPSGPGIQAGEVNWNAFAVDTVLTGLEYSGAPDELVFTRPTYKASGMYVTDPFIGPSIAKDGRVFSLALGFQKSDLSVPYPLWDDGSLDVLNVGGLPRVAEGVWVVDEEIRTAGPMTLSVELLDEQTGNTVSVPVVIPQGPLDAKTSGQTAVNIQFVGVVADPGYHITALHFTEPLDRDLIHYAGVVYRDVVPEPATMGLMVIGAVAGVITRRRLRARK
jgi:hypothetical protein